MEKIEHILLVDDDEVNNFITKKNLLHSLQVEKIEIKLNGREAADYLDNCGDDFPSLVLLDINMPLMNGFELLDYYMNTDYSGKVKFAMLSTSNHESDMEKAKTYKDVISYIVKPLNPEKIKELISIL